MRTARVLLAFAIVATLSACGFGGDDDAPSPTRPSDPIETAAEAPTSPAADTPAVASPAGEPGSAAELAAALVSAAQGDSARTGRQPGPGVEGGPFVAWALEVNAPVRAASVLADGILLVVTEGVDGALLALDAVTGQELWRRAGGSGASPAVADGLVFVGVTGSFDAVDLRTGATVWSFRTQTEHWTSAVAADGAVYVCDLDNRLLYALDAATGRQRWNLRGFNRPPAAVGGAVYAADADALFALDAATGSTRWVAYMDAVGNPAVAGDAVYVVAEALGTPIRYQLIALEEQGAERWRADLGAVAPTSPAVSLDEQTVFVAAGEPGEQTDLIAIDAATGDRRFTVDTGSVGVADPVVDDRLVYLTGGNGRVAAFDTASGETVWDIAPVSGALTAPVVAGGLAFVGNAGPVNGLVLAIGGRPEAATPAATPSVGVAAPLADTRG